ncbi:CotH kinase family protein [Amphibacillus jilinensis]|uniref:CotH kinase family protein n=1 Tax=Amphibacillus jilinensis TaxID=1216008 RepID=UPI0003132F41|nr:CotH kinase family protein [Amphibacillus jilinensis]
MIKNRYVIGVFIFIIGFGIGLYHLFQTIAIEESTVSSRYTDTVFDQTQVSQVEIELAEEDLDYMLENPLEETYVNASVTINGQTVTNVGIRTKGNMTLTSVANMDSDRYSFKIDFDQYDNNQTLDGLSTLNLNNNYSDSTLMREYISYEIMEGMGIETPAHSYMYVTINGQEWGLYLGVEQINESFLNRTMDDATGDLYKPDGVGSDLVWISEDIEDYTGLNLKTNEGTSDQSAMIAMLDAINNSDDTDLEQYLNVDQMLRYFAVNTALVNLDHYQGQMKHNYYLYEQDGVFSILPWDYNMSFGGFSMGAGGANIDDISEPENGDLDISEMNMPDFEQNDGDFEIRNNQDNGNQNNMGMGMMGSDMMNESSINFSITEPVSGTTLEERPLLNALLSVDDYRERYESYLKEVATTYFSENYMEDMTANIASIILAYVEADPTKFTTTEEFLQGVSGDESLVAFATARAESILAQLSGELVVEASTTTGFERNGQQASDGEDTNNRFGNNEPNSTDQIGSEGVEDDQPNRFQNMPEDGEMPNFDEMPEGGDMPNRGQGPGDQNNQKPDFQNDQENERIEASESINLQSVSIISILFIILIIAITFVSRFRRRRV